MPQPKKLADPRQRPLPCTIATTNATALALPRRMSPSRPRHLHSHARRRGQHLLHTHARARRALDVARRANGLAELLALLGGDESLACARELLDRLGVEAYVGFQAY